MTEALKSQYTDSTILDRSQFDEHVSLMALIIPAHTSSLFMKQLKGHLLAMKKLKAIHPVPQEHAHLVVSKNDENVENVENDDQKKNTENVNHYRMILLDPKYQSWSDLPTSVASFLSEQGFSHDSPLLIRHSIVIGYAQMTAEQVLKQILIKNRSSLKNTKNGTVENDVNETNKSSNDDDDDGTIEVPSAFEQVGHIAHLNLRDEWLPYKHLIGQVILDKSPMIETVVNKVGMIDSVYREAKLEVLAGKPDFNVELKEHGMRFKLNFAEVYWNSRLAHEHRRVLKHMTKTDVICDMMAGIGPFAVPAAKTIGCRVHANDLNPKSYEYMCINAKLNKVNHLVSCYNMDGRDFVRMLVGKGIRFDHVLMNLPGSAVEFLDVFINLFPESVYAGHMPMIHVYTFIKGDSRTESEKMAEDAKRVVERYLGVSDPSAISYTEVVDVRDVAPKKNMYCVSFRLPESVGLIKSTTTGATETAAPDGVGVGVGGVSVGKRKLEEANDGDSPSSSSDDNKKIKL